MSNWRAKEQTTTDVVVDPKPIIPAGNPTKKKEKDTQDPPPTSKKKIGPIDAQPEDPPIDKS